MSPEEIINPTTQQIVISLKNDLGNFRTSVICSNQELRLIKTLKEKDSEKANQLTEVLDIFLENLNSTYDYLNSLYSENNNQ